MKITRYKFHSLLLSISIFLSLSLKGQVSRKWRIQHIPIMTRWSKNVTPNNVLPEYPRPQLMRDGNWINLNGLWQYTVTKDSSDVNVEFKDSILVPYPIESALSGVQKKLLPSEELWYKKTFKAIKTANKKKYLLHFGAVDWQATVYLNEIEVGKHTGGYTAFTCDITNALKNGENTLLVKVIDPTEKGIGPHGKQVLTPENIYYTSSSGIWQTVWVEEVPQLYIKNLIMVPNIDNKVLKIRIELEGDAKGTTVIANASNGKSAFGKSNEQLEIKVPYPHLWSPDDPYLYNLSVEIIDSATGSLRDRVDSYFGMRKIEVKKDPSGHERLFLNNKPLYNLGTLDQGFWPDGLYTAPTDEALSFDIHIIKAMGFNTIRKHIKVEPDRWYYHADKIGMIVWQDFVNPNQRLPEGSKQAFENDLCETINQLYNHPCITTWVLFNEKWGQYDQKRLTELVKNLDSTRLIDGHSGELLYVNDKLRSPSPNAFISSDIVDIHSYPFPKMPPYISGKVQVIGEFGGLGVPIERHMWDDVIGGWGYNGLGIPSTLKIQYSKMIDSLVLFKKNGLSASIYTQPFDVESEQNGLVSYDREVTKIPLSEIRKINSKLVPFKSRDSKFDQSLKNVDTILFNYNKRKISFGSNILDSANLRGLSIMALANRDTIFALQVFDKYLQMIVDTFSVANLKYINHFTLNIDGNGFKIFFKNTHKVSNILGNNVAENVIMNIIFKEKIEPLLADTIVNWKRLEQSLIPKYGELAEERINSAKVVYYWEKKDWVNFGRYYKKHFEKVLLVNRNGLHINNLSWAVFQNVNDTGVLNVAIKIMKYNLDKFDKLIPNSIDTYANLLYKVGQRTEALQWEAKAINLSNNAENYRLSYDKMVRNEKTWK